MKICITSAADKKLEYQYMITNVLKKEYCDKFGYDFKFHIVKKKEGKEKFEPWFAKVEACKMHLKEGYDWVLWLDADAWIEDFTTPLTKIIDTYADESTSLIVSRTSTDEEYKGVQDKKKATATPLISHYINSGAMLFKKGEDSLYILDAMKDESFTPECNRIMDDLMPLRYDQPRLAVRILFDRRTMEHTKVIPASKFNWLGPNGDMEGKFILHFCDLSLPMRSIPAITQFIDYTKKSMEKKGILKRREDVRIFMEKALDSAKKQEEAFKQRAKMREELLNGTFVTKEKFALPEGLKI